VKEVLNDIKRRGSTETERSMLTHCTMAEPRFLDATIDPNDRAIGRCFMGEPRLVNFSPAGIARYSTLRAWLSQWSIDDSQAQGLKNIRDVTVPLFVLENSADDAVPQPHTRMLFEASGSEERAFEVIPGATHYYSGQPEHLQKAVDLTFAWLHGRGLMD
jgi:hypothetical protein